MFFLQTSPSIGASKDFQSIFWNKNAAAKRNGNLVSELVETTDFGNDAQFIVFARCCATEDYVEQSLLCPPLDKRITRKEMLKKVESFTKWYQLSRTHCVSVCADSAYSAIIRIKKLHEIMKNENKKFRGLLSSSRKNQKAKKFNIWQFLNRFHLLLITSHTHSLCVARCGQNTVDVCFI